MTLGARSPGLVRSTGMSVRRKMLGVLWATLTLAGCGGSSSENDPRAASPTATEPPEVSTPETVEESPTTTVTEAPADPEETFILAIRVLPDFDLDGNGDEAKKQQWIADARQVCSSIQESGSDEQATADMSDKYGIFEGPFFVGAAQSAFCPETS